jgi:hypothetical protein
MAGGREGATKEPERREEKRAHLREEEEVGEGHHRMLPDLGWPLLTG